MSVAQLHQRWAIRSDLPGMMAIESFCFTDPWTANDWAICLRQRNTIAMVAEAGEEMVGFMAYELESDGVHLIKLAVHPKRQREGTGRTMLTRLQDKLSADRRKRVYLEIHEENTDGQVSSSLRFSCVACVAWLLRKRVRRTCGRVRDAIPVFKTAKGQSVMTYSIEQASAILGQSTAFVRRAISRRFLESHNLGDWPEPRVSRLALVAFGITFGFRVTQ